MLLSLTAKLLHVMLKRRLNLFTAENNSESVDVLTHSNTGTPGTVTCLPVAAVECLKLEREPKNGLFGLRRRVFFSGYAFGYGHIPLAPTTEL